MEWHEARLGRFQELVAEVDDRVDPNLNQQVRAKARLRAVREVLPSIDNADWLAALGDPDILGKILRDMLVQGRILEEYVEGVRRVGRYPALEAMSMDEVWSEIRRPLPVDPRRNSALPRSKGRTTSQTLSLKQDNAA